MSPLAYIPEATAFTATWKQLPFLQGHRASSGAIRALIRFQSSNGRSVADRPAHPNRAKALRVLQGKSGAIDEVDGAKLLAYYGVRRPKERAVGTPAGGGVRPHHRVPGGREALAPEIRTRRSSAG
jgi:hypothetical protein